MYRVVRIGIGWVSSSLLVVACGSSSDHGGTGGSGASIARDSTSGVFEFAGSSSVVAGAAQADAPAAMAADATSIWLAEPNAGALVRVDRVTRQEIDTAPVPGTRSENMSAVSVRLSPFASVRIERRASTCVAGLTSSA